MAQRARDEREIPIFFIVMAGLALLVLLAPVVVTVLAAFNAGNYLQFPPDGFSLRWIYAYLESPLFRENFLFSFRLALLVTIISTILGTAASIALSRISIRGRNVLRVLFLAPIVLPGMVIGLALLSFYASVNLGLMRTFAGLVLGHVLVTMPFVIGTVSAALARFSPSREEAARSLGAGPFRAFWDVTMQVISQGMLGGATFAFIVSFGQFDVSLFLATVDLRPLPVALYDSIRFRTDPTIAAAGVFAVATVILSMLLGYFISTRGRPRKARARS
jgi:putative spermidine/putrescine transport system permease protein